MVDVVLGRVASAGDTRRRAILKRTMQRKSTAAFLMTLPLLLLMPILGIAAIFILRDISRRGNEA